MKVEDLRYQAEDREWFGRVTDFSSGHPVELTVEGDPDSASLPPRLALVRDLAATVEPLVEQLHQLVYRKYQGTRWPKPLAEIRTMYSLGAVTLKRDNATWWFVLEPEYHVGSVYNHLFRFTWARGEIVWSNLDQATTP